MSGPVKACGSDEERTRDDNPASVGEGILDRKSDKEGGGDDGDLGGLDAEIKSEKTGGEGSGGELQILESAGEAEAVDEAEKEHEDETPSGWARVEKVFDGNGGNAESDDRFDDRGTDF